MTESSLRGGRWHMCLRVGITSWYYNELTIVRNVQKIATDQPHLIQ
jgi:hypothetical protein